MTEFKYCFDIHTQRMLNDWRLPFTILSFERSEGELEDFKQGA
jgi:hypothetical protein